MKITLTNKNNFNCECCGAEFTCQAQNIVDCNCSKVELNLEERSYIGLKFMNCLCNTCLIKLKTEANLAKCANSPRISSTKMVLVIFLISFSLQLFSQTYAPAAEQPGSSAMHADSSVFINWVSACNVTRGYQDISDKVLGYTNVGDPSMCIGKALSNGVLSLGDGGSVICSFNFPITNGAGYDFAVFENGITDTFLELAFVEVSSDGINFFRFKSHSLSDTLNQTGSFGATDATKINNLAGKYRAGFGTPFDLQELSGLNGLDIENVTHIKIIDVIGSIHTTYASHDGYGNKLNDPWPTPFPSGGFDLDAIGVIHENKITSLQENSGNNTLTVYPNPILHGETLLVRSTEVVISLDVFSLAGDLILHSNSFEVSTQVLSQGIYILKIKTAKGFWFAKLLVN